MRANHTGETVVYSRAIFLSFWLTPSDSFSIRKSLTSCHKFCETRVSSDGAELVPNQIPPSALMQAFIGCGSVAVLVTIRVMSQ